jgi:acetaldehyde dehydrogenase (acetylating)
MISDKDLLSRQQARQLAKKTREAANILAEFSQDQIDLIIDAMAEAVDKEAETLARMAVEETTYGKYEDKIIKNRFSSRQVYNFIRPLKTAGVIGEDKDRKVIMIAEPVGVVAAVLPSTNPTSTAIYKILISIKGRNGIVLSPHPSAKKCICHAADVMMRAALAAGAPEGSITCLTDVSQEGTQELLMDRNVSVILATGGMGIVRLAYSCGKPAFGVGPGNVPALIEKSANVPKAVRDILTGKTFDNGLLCSSEQAIVCEGAVKEQALVELRKSNVYFLNEQEMQAVGKVLITPTFGVNPKVVGKPAPYIASQAGIQVPPETRVLIAPLNGVGKEFPLSLEKLSPVLAFYEASDFNSCVELCIRLIRFGGMGHTMAIHSTNRDLILEAGLRIPVFRMIVNSPSTHGSVGLTTGLDPAMTLGCGAVGGNITSDNISPLHLINVKRVAYELREAKASSPELPSRSSQSVVSASSASIEERINRFLDQKGIAKNPKSSPPPETSPSDSSVVKVGQHKIYPVRSPETSSFPKSSVIPNPSVNPISGGNPGHNPQVIGPVDFVCEDDVRQAILKKQTIAIHSKTIITPSAQDLAVNQNVFKKID